MDLLTSPQRHPPNVITGGNAPAAGLTYWLAPSGHSRVSRLRRLRVAFASYLVANALLDAPYVALREEGVPALAARVGQVPPVALVPDGGRHDAD